MVYEKVVSIVADQINVNEEEITEESTFEELGIDEMDLAELVITLEGEFEVEIHDDEFAKINSVSDLVDIIETAIELG